MRGCASRSLARSCFQYSLVSLISYCLLGSWTMADSGVRMASEVPHRLRFFHTHTRERVDIEYSHGNTYDPDALAQINHYLRDHRTGEVHTYDPRVFDLLHDLTVALRRADAEIEVICGYRTPWSNEYLRTHAHGLPRPTISFRESARRELRPAAWERNNPGVLSHYLILRQSSEKS